MQYWRLKLVTSLSSFWEDGICAVCQCLFIKSISASSLFPLLLFALWKQMVANYECNPHSSDLSASGFCQEWTVLWWFWKMYYDFILRQSKIYLKMNVSEVKGIIACLMSLEMVSFTAVRCIDWWSRRRSLSDEAKPKLRKTLHRKTLLSLQDICRCKTSKRSKGWSTAEACWRKKKKKEKAEALPEKTGMYLKSRELL